MLLAQLHNLSKIHPDKPALIYGEKRLTYQALCTSIMVLAEKLHKADIKKGDFVCILLPNSADFVISFFAIAALGAIAIPLDKNLKPGELKRHLEGIKLAAVISNANIRNHVPVKCPLISPETEGVANSLSYQPFEGPVLCQFSSGSTGLPKQVVRTQQQLLHETRQLAAAIKLNNDDVVVVIVPLYHAHGFGNAMMLALLNGLHLVIPVVPESADGRELPLNFWRSKFLELLKIERVTILPAVPFLFNLLAKTPDIPDELSLRLCISAGSAIDKNTFLEFSELYGIPIRQLYGCTEAGSVTLNTNDDIDQNWGSVGRPLPGIELQLESSENLIAFRSKACADGYYNGNNSTFVSFHDGWFRPGDTGRLDEAGNLYILGRYRSFIVCSGFKVDPSEVEHVIQNYPGVAETVVFGVPHPSAGELVKAVVVPKPDTVINPDELYTFCSVHLADHKLPRILEIRDSLPRSALGKVLIKELI